MHENVNRSYVCVCLGIPQMNRLFVMQSSCLPVACADFIRYHSITITPAMILTWLNLMVNRGELNVNTNDDPPFRADSTESPENESKWCAPIIGTNTHWATDVPFLLTKLRGNDKRAQYSFIEAQLLRTTRFNVLCKSNGNCDAKCITSLWLRHYGLQFESSD